MFNKMAKVVSSTWFILTAFMLIMLYFRIVPIYGMIFTDWPWLHGNYVNFAPDDAVYHMRLVHNALQHFPTRIFFDPFTHFPYGNQIHFGPLFTLIIASIAWILGGGHPGANLINAVGAYVPPVMGALCLLPVYFIGKKMLGRNAGLLAAAILTFLSGEFFYRSTLGFTDHHVAEVLFSTLTFAFLVYALSLAQSKVRIYVWYALGSGLALGLYLLTWPAALLVGSILFIFFWLQFLGNYWRNVSSDSLMFIAFLVCLVPMVMVLPYSLDNPRFQIEYYSLAQPVILAVFLSGLVLFYALNKAGRYFHVKKTHYCLLMGGGFFLSLLCLSIFSPHLTSGMVRGIALLFTPKPGMMTVAEVWPSILNRETGNLTYNIIWHNFFWMFPLALIAATRLVERMYKKHYAYDLLLFVWSICMVMAMFAQQRFAYYVAINVALLAGYAAYEFLDYLQVKFLYNQSLHKQKKQKLNFIVFVVGIVLMFIAIVYPRTILTDTYSWFNRGLSRDTYVAYMWLNRHTPNPENIKNGFDYQKGFYALPKNLENFSYPASAYGVLAWWCVGHQITYIAERIPNANPFQKGIVESDGAGVAAFFTSLNEADALQNLEKLRARYVFIDNHTAAEQYRALLIWEGRARQKPEEYRVLNWRHGSSITAFKIFSENPEYYKTILYNLYFLDGNNLRHLRLVYETPSDYIANYRTFNLATHEINRSGYTINANREKLQEMIQNGKAINGPDGRALAVIYDAKPPVKLIKIFEYVRGAVLTGKAPWGTRVQLRLRLITNAKRDFWYQQETIATVHGYSFIVPYATESMSGKNYASAVKVLGPYVLQIGKQQKKIFVTEKAVQTGEELRI